MNKGEQNRMEFALLTAAGMRKRDAYSQSFGKTDMSDEAARKAARKVSRKDEILKKVSRLAGGRLHVIMPACQQLSITSAGGAFLGIIFAGWWSMGKATAGRSIFQGYAAGRLRDGAGNAPP